MATRRRNQPIATWDVHDPDGRRLRLYKPTPSCAYLTATWYEPGAEGQQRTTLGTDVDDARRWCETKVERLQRAQRRRRPERPLLAGEALVREYLDPDNHPGWGTRRTVTKQRNLTGQFIPARLLERPCELWSTEDLRGALLAAVPGHSRSYLQDIRNMLSGLVRTGVELGYLDADQINMTSVKVPKRRAAAGAMSPHGEHDEDHYGPRVDRHQLPGIDRIHELAATLPPLYALLVLLAAYSGMRWGELVALRPENVDLERRTIAVDRALAEDTDGNIRLQLPKNNRTRITFFPGWLTEDLALAVKTGASNRESGGVGLVFPAPKGGFLRRSNFGRRMWAPARRAAGWPDDWTFHTLRHCAAVWMLYDQRFDVHDVAAVLGHADPTITQRIYVQPREGVAERLATLAS